MVAGVVTLAVKLDRKGIGVGLVSKAPSHGILYTDRAVAPPRVLPTLLGKEVVDRPQAGPKTGMGRDNDLHLIGVLTIYLALAQEGSIPAKHHLHHPGGGRTLVGSTPASFRSTISPISIRPA
jgi:hypothetical protein